MEATDQKIRWPELVSDLAKVTSKSQLSKRLGVNPKEVGRWIKGASTPQGANAQKLLEEAAQSFINWRKYVGLTPIYDVHHSYEKNVADGPQGISSKTWGLIPNVPAMVLGYKLNSPLGVPASVLTINSSWIAPLAMLGFDVLTYKTVRATPVPAHPFPNCVYVTDLVQPVSLGDRIPTPHGSFDLPNGDVSRISLANSFGMPSPGPKEWQEDVTKTLALLRSGQILIVSVVGTITKPGDDLVADFIRCARLAFEVRPHAIELNFSCPNVYVKEEGSVFHDPELAGRIVKQLRAEIPEAKILVKIGFLRDDELRSFFEQTYKFVDGYTAINSTPMKVLCSGQRDAPVFSGQNRSKPGVSGVAIREYALETVKNLNRLAVAKEGLAIIGVGGIAATEDVKEFLAAGATCVQMCTGAMLNPFLAAEIRKQLRTEGYSQSHSRIVDRSGLAVPFADNATAMAFDSTLEACAESDVPFEMAFAALQKNWLNGYLSEIRNLSRAGSPVKTRRDPPSKDIILEWVRGEALKKSKQ